MADRGNQAIRLIHLRVNTAPAYTAGSDVILDLLTQPRVFSGAWASGISKGISTYFSESGQRLSFRVSNDSPALFSQQPAIDTSGTLTFTVASAFRGRDTANVSVRLGDSGGRLFNGVDSSASTSFRIILSNLTGVSQEVVQASILAYPNPTSGTLILSRPVKSYCLTDLAGKMVMKGEEKTRHVNLELLPAGSYLLRVNNTILPIQLIR